MKRDQITPELNANQKPLSFTQEDHPKPYFRDELQKTRKDILKPDRISGAFFRKPTVLFQLFRFIAQKVKDNFQCEIILGNNGINQEEKPWDVFTPTT